MLTHMTAIYLGTERISMVDDKVYISHLEQKRKNVIKVGCD